MRARSGRAEAGLQGMQLTFDAGQRNKRPGGCRWPTATLSGPGEPFLHIIVPKTPLPDPERTEVAGRVGLQRERLSDGHLANR